MNCLIITDIQNDFCPGGALAIGQGDQVISVINKISSRFDKVIATQDWHPAGHISFASTHGRPPFEVISAAGEGQVLWPDHCVQGSLGAELHKDLDLASVDLILRKGNDPNIDSYSSFVENDKVTRTGLQYYLWGLGIRHIYLCGLATDYCVYYSAMDAIALGFKVTVIIDACQGVDVPAGHVKKVIGEMLSEHIMIETHDVALAENFPSDRFGRRK